MIAAEGREFCTIASIVSFRSIRRASQGSVFLISLYESRDAKADVGMTLNECQLIATTK